MKTKEIDKKVSARAQWQKLLDRITDEMYEEVYCCALVDDYAHKTFDVKSGYIEITMYRNGESEIWIFHNENDHDSTMLQQAIAKNLPDWGEVEALAEYEDKQEENFQKYLWQNCRW